MELVYKSHPTGFPLLQHSPEVAGRLGYQSSGKVWVVDLLISFSTALLSSVCTLCIVEHSIEKLARFVNACNLPRVSVRNAVPTRAPVISHPTPRLMPNPYPPPVSLSHSFVPFPYLRFAPDTRSLSLYIPVHREMFSLSDSFPPVLTIHTDVRSTSRVPLPYRLSPFSIRSSRSLSIYIPTPCSKAFIRNFRVSSL
jgi:hypothetical protein